MVRHANEDIHDRNVATLLVQKEYNPFEIINATFLGNEKRNYYGNYCGDSLTLQWKYFLGSGKTIVTAEAGVEVWAGAGWTGQPLITKEYGVTYLYQGSFDHHLKKLSLDSGKLIWEYEFDDILKGTGTILYNENAKDSLNRLMIYQGSRKGLQYSVSDTSVSSFRAVSCITGKEQWRMPMAHTRCYSSDVDASPIFIDGTGYIGLENGYFVSFHPEESTRWTDTSFRPVVLTSDLLYSEQDAAEHGGNLVTEASPARIGNHLYIASGCGHIFGYNLETKKIDWDYKVSADIDGTPVVTSDNCLLISIEKQYIPGHGGILKINPNRSLETCVDWYYPTKDRNFSSWIGGVIGSVSVNDNYRTAEEPYLAAFTGIDGILTIVDYMTLSGTTAAGPDGITQYPVPQVHFTSDIGPSISTPMFTLGHIVAAGYTGIRIFKEDSVAKYKLTSYQAGMFEASPICHNGRVVIASRDGYLYCYGDQSTMFVDSMPVKVAPQFPDVVKNTPQWKEEKHMAVVEKRELHASKDKPSIQDTLIKHLLVVQERRLTASKSLTKLSAAPAVVIPQSKTGSYLLIAGVFKSETNANNYAKLWKRRGYPAEVIQQPSGMNYVSILRGESEEEVNVERSKVKWGKDPVGWVWTSHE